MMMSRAIPTRETHPAMLPPGVYILAASLMLAVARRLYNVGLLPPSGLRATLIWSEHLSRAGIRSWRQRRTRRGR